MTDRIYDDGSASEPIEGCGCAENCKCHGSGGCGCKNGECGCHGDAANCRCGTAGHKDFHGGRRGHGPMLTGVAALYAAHFASKLVAKQRELENNDPHTVVEFSALGGKTPTDSPKLFAVVDKAAAAARKVGVEVRVKR